MTQYRVGLIGLGKIGQLRKDILQQFTNIKIIGYYDTQKKNTKLKYYDNSTKLIKDADILFIAVPHVFTKQYVVEALESGKHVFSEKPPGISVSEVQEMRKAEEQSGCKLKFGFNHRYHEVILKANELINDFGELIWLRGVYGRRDPGEYWRDEPKFAGRGILLSQGIHMLDLFRMFAGEFTEVKSFIRGYPIERNVFAILRTNNGVTASLHSSSLMYKHTFELTIGCEDGYLVIKNILTGSGSFGGYETLRTGYADTGIRGNPVETVQVFNQDHSWRREIAEFIMDVELDRKVNWGSSIDALNNMKLIERIYKNDSKY